MIKADQTTQASPTSHIEQLAIAETSLETLTSQAHNFKVKKEYSSAIFLFEEIYNTTRDIHARFEQAHCNKLAGNGCKAEEIYENISEKAREYETRHEYLKAISLFDTLYLYTEEEVYLLDSQYLKEQLRKVPSVAISIINSSIFKPLTEELESFPTPASSPERNDNFYT